MKYIVLSMIVVSIKTTVYFQSSMILFPIYVTLLLTNNQVSNVHSTLLLTNIRDRLRLSEHGEIIPVSGRNYAVFSAFE